MFYTMQTSKGPEANPLELQCITALRQYTDIPGFIIQTLPTLPTLSLATLLQTPAYSGAYMHRLSNKSNFYISTFWKSLCHLCGQSTWLTVLAFKTQFHRKCKKLSDVSSQTVIYLCKEVSGKSSCQCYINKVPVSPGCIYDSDEQLANLVFWPGVITLRFLWSVKLQNCKFVNFLFYQIKVLNYHNDFFKCQIFLTLTRGAISH